MREGAPQEAGKNNGSIMSIKWDGIDRRAQLVISTEQLGEMLEAAAERGSKKALDAIYAEIGRSLVKKTALVLGALLAALLAWINSAVTVGIGAPK